MSLDERLERARHDYRALEQPDRAELVVALDDPPAGRHRHSRLLVAAALLVAVVGGVVVAAGVGDDDDVTRTEPPPATEPEGPTATERRTVVLLDDEPPYEDGQEVVVRVPAELGADLGAHGGIALCASVETVVGSYWSATEACGADLEGDLVVPGTADVTSVVVRLRREVATRIGTVDCSLPSVTCRLEVEAADGDRRRSPRLTFVPATPPTVPPAATLHAEGEPGTFVLRTEGLAPDPSWLDLRDDPPGEGEGTDEPAFVVWHCATSASRGGIEGPFGEDLWDQEPAGRDVPVCDPRPVAVAIDPDDPNQARTVTLPTLVTGPLTADCRVDQCYLDVRKTYVASHPPDGPVVPGDISVATAVLPREGPWPQPIRPSLTVATPGPHRPGQTVAVTVAGLSDGETMDVGTCHGARPWSCDVADEAFDLGNGTYEIPLLAGAMRGCGPEDCYLALGGGSEGSPPLAVAPLDTPG